MITRYDPFREMLSLRDVMDRLFQEAMVMPGMIRGFGAGMAVPMDVRETDDAYDVGVSLPGWKPDDVSVTIQQNTVSISGQEKPEDQARRESGSYHLRERKFAAFNRTFTFPAPIDADRADARFENGELFLRLPKAESARPRQIPISGRAGLGAGRQQLEQARAEQQEAERRMATQPSGVQQMGGQAGQPAGGQPSQTMPGESAGGQQGAATQSWQQRS